MLTRKIIRRAYRSKFLHIADNLEGNTNSGIRATVFGATGCVGNAVVNKLAHIGSDVIMPTRFRKEHDDKVKTLKHEGDQSMSYIMWDFNYNDPMAISRSVAKSNVVINLVGPSKYTKNLSTFESVNVETPRRIAREARKRGAKKLVHFSAVGVAPNSPSLDLRTKYYGEQAVRDEFPEAIIIRPTLMIGWDDHFSYTFKKMQEYCFSFIPFHGDLNTLKQPIMDHDVGLAVFNALKLSEANGQTFELGGPNVYTRRELYELMINILKRPMSLAKIPETTAMNITKYFNTNYFNREDILKDSIDMIIQKREGVKTIEDLFVRPGSIVPFLEKSLQEEATPVVNTIEDIQARK